MTPEQGLPEQGLAFGLMAVTIAAFLWGKRRHDLIALSDPGAGTILGIIPVEEMFFQLQQRSEMDHRLRIVAARSHRAGAGLEPGSLSDGGGDRRDVRYPHAHRL
jgi:hypothetical protein